MTQKKHFILAAALVLSCAGVLRADSVVSKADKVVIQTYISEKPEVRGYLSKGERAEIFNKTTYTATMDGLEGRWYFIQTSTGLTGWVFGGKLTFETSAAGFTLVDVQQITDGSKEVFTPAISPDMTKVAYAESNPSSGVRAHDLLVYDTKTKKSKAFLSTRFLVGPHFAGLGWKSNNLLFINMHNGVDRSYQIEYAFDGSAGLAVTDNAWGRGDPGGDIKRLEHMYRKDPDVLRILREISDYPEHISSRFVFSNYNRRFYACYYDDRASGRQFIPEIRVMKNDDRSVSSIPFWVSRASAPWAGLVTDPGFGGMGPRPLIYYPKGDDAAYSVDRIWENSVEHLFDISGPIIRFADTQREDILYVYTHMPYKSYAPIKLYKYASGKPLRLVVPKSENWTTVSFSPDGSRVVYSKMVKGKNLLFTATVKE